MKLARRTRALSTCSAETLSIAFDAYQRGLDQCEPAGKFVNDQRALFAFFHCAQTREEAIASEAAVAALWFMNCQPDVYSIRRTDWIESIRANSVMWVDGKDKTLDQGEEQPDFAFDHDDPVPVISLMNRQAAGEKIDPVEAYEALEPYDAVIIGDVEACRRKIRRLDELGLDRLMCLMQMGPMRHEDVMRSIRVLRGHSFFAARQSC